MSDEEWAIFEPFLTPATGRPPKSHRRVLDGIFWIARTGAQWRDLPAEFGNWNSVWKQFRRWAVSGVFDVMLQGCADSGGDTDMLQMIDSTVIRAHRCAAGIKGDSKSGARPLPRRLFHQDPPPGERRRDADRGRGDARPGARRHGLWRADGTA
jgi:transposase